VVAVLYDDPVSGYPRAYTRDDLPRISRYPPQSAGDAPQAAPSPRHYPFEGQVKLLGSVSGELGLRPYLEGLGHEYVVTSSKDGPDAELEKHLSDAEVYVTKVCSFSSRTAQLKPPRRAAC
jgi:formate dehydrogenase